MSEPDRDPGRTRGVYSIAIAAELVGVGIQTLRLYESRGLVDPARSAGGTRRYSDADVDVLRRVVRLLAEGVNLAGARQIIQLEDDNHALRAIIAASKSTNGE
ncbi:MerR family transcriptional regulator [Microbacterium sp. bgisy189]|uniref:MerR family transcriptional regulator n=1 Tax=Microbacterium sp. bgisy189 TaxID=3413798 RepID=UPI003EB8D71F